MPTILEMFLEMFLVPYLIVAIIATVLGFALGRYALPVGLVFLVLGVVPGAALYIYLEYFARGGDSDYGAFVAFLALFYIFGPLGIIGIILTAIGSVRTGISH